MYEQSAQLFAVGRRHYDVCVDLGEENETER